MNLYDFLIKKHLNIKRDLANLIKIKSVASKSQKKMPHGIYVAKCFYYIKTMCIRDGLNFYNYDGYIGEIVLGKGKKEDITLLHHIDVVDIFVEDEWDSNPFLLTEKNNMYFGRGVNDNKGPLVYSYYMFLYIMQYEKNLYKDILLKLLIGGAEETSWKGIKFYKEHFSEPKYSFSPDGNFPLVNIEKGVLKLQISKSLENNHFIINSAFQDTFNCHKVQLNFNDEKFLFNSVIEKSRNPNRTLSNNAIDELIDWIINASNEEDEGVFVWIKKHLLEKYNGLFKELNCNDWAENTLSVTHIQANEQKINLVIDIRHNKYLQKKIVKSFFMNNGWKCKILKMENYHEVPSNSILVTSLLQAYNAKMNTHEEAITFPGISYARSFKNSVSFGTTFPGEDTKSHRANENITISNMIDSTEILLLGVKNIIARI